MNDRARGVVLTCERCGRTLECESDEGRDALRYAAGWSVATDEHELCPECSQLREEPESGGKRVRRFRRHR